MILIIDNYDSFVYNIAQYISKFDDDIHIYRNDRITITDIEKLNPDAIIISPGPKRPEDANISIDIVKHFHNKKPILGICLGHQVICHVFGAKVTHAKKLVHGKKSEIKHNNDIIFHHIPEIFQAGRYHSLAALTENFPHDKLDILASNTEDNEIMAVKLKNYPVYGFQFHPESILTDHGKTILGNFYNFVMGKEKKTKAIEFAIKKISTSENLSEIEAMEVMTEIMTGSTTPAQIAAYLIGLKLKIESIDEIVGSIKAIKKLMNKIDLDTKALQAVDTCGTGGDSYNTFNISTVAAFITAGAGVPVAKHGNKSVSSKSGSADLLSGLGIKIDADKEKIIKSINEADFGFMFAPLYHPAFKHVAAVRKELGVRTIFNMLGPTVNPAQVKRQSLGIFSPEYTEKFAQILHKTGTKKALIFSSAESMDEISPFSSTKISFLFNNKIQTIIFNPSDFKMQTGKLEDLQVKSMEESKNLTLDILMNKSQNKTAVNAVLLNSAAAIFTSNDESDFKKGFADALKKAHDSLKSGKALDVLNKAKGISNE